MKKSAVTQKRERERERCVCHSNILCAHLVEQQSNEIAGEVRHLIGIRKLRVVRHKSDVNG